MPSPKVWGDKEGQAAGIYEGGQTPAPVANPNAPAPWAMEDRFSGIASALNSTPVRTEKIAAPAPAPPPPAQNAPAASAAAPMMPTQAPQTQPVNPAIAQISAMLQSSNPKVQRMGIQMGQALWQQQLKPNEYKPQVAGDTLYSFDPRTGRATKAGDANKPTALGRDQRLIDPTTGKEIVGAVDTPKFEDVSSTRKEISALPEVKRYGEAAPIFRSMVQSHGKDSAAADLDYVYGVAKIFDPDSVVREGEMKLVGQAQSIPEDVQGLIKRVVSGEGRLTADARHRILEVAQTRMNELRGAYDTRLKPYEGIASANKIPLPQIMPGNVDLPVLPERKQTETGAPDRAAVEKEMRRRGLLK